MKTITIKQPWASLIVHGIKDVINSTWKTNYRGRMLIHAGLSKPKIGYFDYEPFKSYWRNAGSHCGFSNKEMIEGMVEKIKFNHGAIIGSVEIVDCVINHPSIWAEKSPEYTTKRANQKEFNPIYNWVLANPILFDKPILNVKGRLSFWEYELPVVGNTYSDADLQDMVNLWIDHYTKYGESHYATTEDWRIIEIYWDRILERVLNELELEQHEVELMAERISSLF